jgi:hypothetical protein
MRIGPKRSRVLYRLGRRESPRYVEDLERLALASGRDDA